ncbi:MAG: hypothetical protein ACI9R3_003167 [Verrucomicrobiales bacterium]
MRICIITKKRRPYFYGRRNFSKFSPPQTQSINDWIGRGINKSLSGVEDQALLAMNSSIRTTTAKTNTMKCIVA